MGKLATIDPNGPEKWDKDKIKEENEQLCEEISAKAIKLYAEEKQSVLVVLQGLDATGKDGAIRTVFGKVNPFVLSLSAWKKPTEEEFAHDFLWRIHKETPKKGQIKIFNRSHYEDILVPGVEGYVKGKELDKRFQHINNFEALLEDNGTHILKFYLHTDTENQLKRLTERTQLERKFWKHSDGDWEVREKRDAYLKMYERIFEECSQIPWHIVPSNKNWVKTNIIAREVIKILDKINPQWPALESKRF